MTGRKVISDHQVNARCFRVNVGWCLAGVVDSFSSPAIGCGMKVGVVTQETRLLMAQRAPEHKYIGCAPSVLSHP